ncbi:hypothetical protein [Streptomyces xanthochromogenes]
MTDADGCVPSGKLIAEVPKHPVGQLLATVAEVENIARTVLSLLYDRAVFKAQPHQIANFIAGTLAPHARNTEDALATWPISARRRAGTWRVFHCIGWVSANSATKSAPQPP